MIASGTPRRRTGGWWSDQPAASPRARNDGTARPVRAVVSGVGLAQPYTLRGRAEWLQRGNRNGAAISGPRRIPRSERVSTATRPWSTARSISAVLLTTGVTGPARRRPFHPAKMAARLQAATTSGRPVLLYVSTSMPRAREWDPRRTRSRMREGRTIPNAFILWQTAGGSSNQSDGWDPAGPCPPSRRPAVAPMTRKCPAAEI